MSLRNERRTGATRHRAEVTGLFRRKVALVLQIEVEWDDGPSDSNGMPEYLSGRGWRDATPSDLPLTAGVRASDGGEQ